MGVKKGQEGKKTREHTARGTKEGAGTEGRTGNQDYERRKVTRYPRFDQLDPGLASGCAVHPCAHV